MYARTDIKKPLRPGIPDPRGNKKPRISEVVGETKKADPKISLYFGRSTPWCKQYFFVAAVSNFSSFYLAQTIGFEKLSGFDIFINPSRIEL